ncbi:MAG: Cu/Ag efflux protein CusF [Candidatus Azotimanducaceae bacterium]|jgi:Cu(I)/Ag(I) efflux system protein CusF
MKSNDVKDKNTTLTKVFVAAVAAIFLFLNSAHAADKNTKMTDKAKGKIVQIDESGRRVKLSHGALKRFDMRPMTMYFGLAGSTDLNNFKINDEVEFEVKQGRDGSYRIMAMCTLTDKDTNCLEAN